MAALTFLSNAQDRERNKEQSSFCSDWNSMHPTIESQIYIKGNRLTVLQCTDVLKHRCQCCWVPGRLEDVQASITRFFHKTASTLEFLYRRNTCDMNALKGRTQEGEGRDSALPGGTEQTHRHSVSPNQPPSENSEQRLCQT